MWHRLYSSPLPLPKLINSFKLILSLCCPSLLFKGRFDDNLSVIIIPASICCHFIGFAFIQLTSVEICNAVCLCEPESKNALKAHWPQTGERNVVQHFRLIGQQKAEGGRRKAKGKRRCILWGALQVHCTDYTKIKLDHKLLNYYSLW